MPALDAFYFYDRSGAPVWLRDEAGRQAAARVAEILDHAPLDGLAEGPALAASVRAAIAGGTLGDDAAISLAWLKYVRALKAPVTAIHYGDPALMLVPPTAKQALSDLLAAPSMLARVNQVAAVNPLYSAVRDQAAAAGESADPRVRATLDRLRLLPATGRAILVDVASAELWMLENGQPVDSMKVVVGKTTSPTPMLAGTINYVTFNPYWHILDDVARRKVAPMVLKRGVSYLKAARYDTIASWSDRQPVDPSTIDWKAVAAGTDHVHIRQKPGAAQHDGGDEVQLRQRLRHLPSRHAAQGAVRQGPAQLQPRLRPARACRRASAQWLLGPRRRPAERCARAARPDRPGRAGLSDLPHGQCGRRQARLRDGCLRA